MTLRFALYDLDNTLYADSSGLMEQINNRIGLFFQEHLQLDAAEAQRLRQSYYEQYGTTLAGLQKHHGVVETEDYLAFIHQLTLDVLLPDDGTLHVALQALPLEKIIFTNSPREHAVRVLNQLGLHDHFEQIFDIRAFEFLAKPDLNAYHTVLRALNAQGDECVLFEDTMANLAPAKSLGITTVLIAPAGTQHPFADIIVPNVLAGTLAIHERCGVPLNLAA